LTPEVPFRSHFVTLAMSAAAALQRDGSAGAPPISA
jgi:hypothetical protein